MFFYTHFQESGLLQADALMSDRSKTLVDQLLPIPRGYALHLF
ncbi:hypothetical protein [Enterococcus casseliflavus]|nr:hypothetical protein [Enterococcus casseliflavus]